LVSDIFKLGVVISARTLPPRNAPCHARLALRFVAAAIMARDFFTTSAWETVLPTRTSSNPCLIPSTISASLCTKLVIASRARKFFERLVLLLSESKSALVACGSLTEKVTSVIIKPQVVMNEHKLTHFTHLGNCADGGWLLFQDAIEEEPPMHHQMPYAGAVHHITVIREGKNTKCAKEI
jgi:hypothetical protein